MDSDPSVGDTPSAHISRTAVQIVRSYTGRGPTKARTTVNHDSVMIVLGDTLTRGERRLVELGKADRVRQLRHDFQLAMQEDLVDLVEVTLERKVIAFMSDNHIDPDFGVEVFVLEPARASS